jgi:hypothetical protein
MPALPLWFSRLEEIVEVLSALTIPVLDRSVVERLFRVRKRRAIEVMHQFGGYSSGNSILLNRQDLIKSLRELAVSPDVAHERVRKTKLARQLVELQRNRAGAQIKIGVRHPAETWPAALPAGVHVRPGQIVVEYGNPQALFKTLYDFGQTAANHYEWLCHVLEPQWRK